MKTTQVIAHITDWLTDYVDNSGATGFVVGVSGGVDSALTSTLAARTGRPLLCVEMAIHQHPDQVSRAREHIRFLESQYANVSDVALDLTGVFDSFIATMPEANDSELLDMSLANTRARLRMTTLYYFAALRGALVAGTGNKVEDFGVGFYTKYGDGGVDLSPIADLMKTEVYSLAEALSVNQAILEASPTDGLWGNDRTDEDQIGASYPELEWAMEFSGNDADLSNREREVLAIYRQRHKANLHKMNPIPVCQIPEALK